MLKQSLLAAVLAVSSFVLAAASTAATITVTAPRFVDVGLSFEVTVTADSEGDEGQVIMITLLHDTAVLSGNGAPVAAERFTQGDGFATGLPSALEGTCGGVFGEGGCQAFNQLFDILFPIDAGPKQAILSYTVLGLSNGQSVDLFGLFGIKTSGAGAFEFAGLDASEVVFSYVPEPAAGALIGLGLLGLGWGRSRRQQQATLDRRAGPGRPHGSS